LRISKRLIFGVGRCAFGGVAIPEKALHLFCNDLFVRGTDQASGVDTVLLGELACTHMNIALIEDVLHGLKNVLAAGCCGGIRVLLAAHHHLYDFAQLYRREVF
jgi:hypothetical protein